MLVTTAFDQRSPAISAPSRTRDGLMMALVTAALVVLGSLTPVSASAQCTSSMGTLSCNSQVHSDGKGMIGLGLIGAELGFIIPALVQDAAHTDEWWPYVVFPLVGAGLGVLGGYFVEDATRNEPEVDIVLLGVGMALIVPTVLGTLALTAYDPGDDRTSEPPDEDYVPPDYEDGTTTEAVQVEDGATAPSTEQAPPPASSEPETGSAASPESSLEGRIRATMAGGPGLLRFRDDGALVIAAPMLQTSATYSRREIRDFGAAAGYDVVVPVVSGDF